MGAVLQCDRIDEVTGTEFTEEIRQVFKFNIDSSVHLGDEFPRIKSAK